MVPWPKGNWLKDMSTSDLASGVNRFRTRQRVSRVHQGLARRSGAGGSDDRGDWERGPISQKMRERVIDTRVDRGCEGCYREFGTASNFWKANSTVSLIRVHVAITTVPRLVYVC